MDAVFLAMVEWTPVVLQRKMRERPLEMSELRNPRLQIQSLKENALSGYALPTGQMFSGSELPPIYPFDPGLLLITCSMKKCYQDSSCNRVCVHRRAC